MSQESCLIDGFGPLSIERPASVAELGEIVRRAAASRQAIYPIGGQTTLGYGMPPSTPGLAVALGHLQQVIDYPARDMTVTVQAGITLAALRNVLATENQRLPVDVPQAERATLGGALAVNSSGPRRYGYGTLRDYVIGISVVSDEGQEVKAGGRVVKNVAGYDLCKLHIGALGTLGVICQVTLKLRPVPERSVLVSLPYRADGVAGLLESLHASRTRPVCLDVLNAEAARTIDPEADGGPDAWRVLIGYEDNEDTVKWQLQELIGGLRAAHSLAAYVDDAAEPLWRRLIEFRGLTDAALTFKANLLPSTVPGFCLAATQAWPALAIQAHAGSGVVVGHAAADLTAEQAAALLGFLREAAAAGGGHVVVLRCPPAWKAALSVWGPPRGDVALMRAVKEKLDPRRLFNPGRFIDGI
ncbi:MAG TPA: FAD-binding oxidoreductase [Gemmataceae bacterium]|nr:FAD-binding oxidoreductase [Gemmataceae bacterium]